MVVDKAAWRARILGNIATHGHHITTVSSGDTPRFSYTLGLWPRRSELCFAGGALCGIADIARVMNAVADADRAGAVEIRGFGLVTFETVLPEWVSSQLLGIGDHHAAAPVVVHQIVPPPERRTFDVPSWSQPLASPTNAAWRFASTTWSLSAPAGAQVATSRRVMMGAPIRYARRFGPSYCEMFAGVDDGGADDMELTTLGVVVAHDLSLSRAADCSVGEGIRRDDVNSPWEAW